MRCSLALLTAVVVASKSAGGHAQDTCKSDDGLCMSSPVASKKQMDGCSAAIFGRVSDDTSYTSEWNFFHSEFERRWAVLPDRNGTRLHQCQSLFASSSIVPLISKANREYLNAMFKFSAGPAGVLKCASSIECLNMLTEMDATAIVDGIEYYLPEANLFVRALKRMLGLYIHINVYYTPAGGKRGFGLHSDETDGIILQLEGAKDWDICGFQSVFDGVVNDMGTPHLEGIDPPRTNPLSKVEQKLIQKCKRTRLHPGDVLYIPAGTVHMAHSALSGPPSLHATIGVARSHHRHTWAGIITIIAGDDGNSQWLRKLLRSSMKLHRLPSAMAKNETDAKGFNTMKCTIGPWDYPPGLRTNLLQEFSHVIEPILLKKNTKKAAKLCKKIRKGSALLDAVSASRELMQSSMMPVGLQFDVSDFPNHSPATGRWQALYQHDYHYQHPFTQHQIQTGVFRRVIGPVVMLVQEDGEWRLFDDVTGGSMAGSTDTAGSGTVLPSSEIQSIQYILGCYTGSALQPFRMADLPQSSGIGTRVIKRLWRMGLIELVPGV